MEHFFGIDIGGSNVKIGLVDTEKGLMEKNKYPTIKLRENNDFVQNFSDVLKIEFEKYPEVNKVGMGIPGTSSKDGRSTIEIPNLSDLDDKPFIDKLESDHPGKEFLMDNDANVAALGEYYFGVEKLPENYVFITLGTGVGSAAIIDHHIWRGGDGNGMEMGHIMSRNGMELEHIIGKKGLMDMINKLLKKSKEDSLIGKKFNTWDTKLLVSAAEGGDKVVLKTFKKVGVLLGEALVTTIRLLDIKTILVGGGISQSYDFVVKPMVKTINKNLTPYYTKDLMIRKATLGNNAGIIGAASLCFK
ncbi:ROK family protein [Bacteroidota bacterium]